MLSDKHRCNTIIMILLFLMLGGCATTGDPNQGGLFGWSEDKANDRLNQYNQLALQNQYALVDEQQIQKNKTDERSRISKDQESYDHLINQQIKKNRELLTEVNHLMRNKKLTEQKKTELKATLKRLRIDAVSKKDRGPLTDEQAMKQKNQELVDAIKALNAN